MKRSFIHQSMSHSKPNKRCDFCKCVTGISLYKLCNHCRKVATLCTFCRFSENIEEIKQHFLQDSHFSIDVI